jgi:hypothetical protein
VEGRSRRNNEIHLISSLIRETRNKQVSVYLYIETWRQRERATSGEQGNDR